MQIKNYNTEPFRFRALFCTDVKDVENDAVIDTWLWFLARPDEDLWLAYGLSDVADAGVAAQLMGSLDFWDTDTLITYIGETWAVIEALPVQHAQMMRDLATKLIEEKVELRRLKGMTQEEVIAERKRDEIESQTGIRHSNN